MGAEENVDRLRRSLEHFVATGEPEWAVLHEDIEVYDHDILDAGEYRGFAGYRRWLEDFMVVWSEFALQPKEYLDAGEHVVAVFRVTAIGRVSGVKVEREDAMVCRMRDGQVLQLDYYNNRQQALEAVGLAE
jgi:ketosteroid isomerase-like protein